MTQNHILTAGMDPFFAFRQSEYEKSVAVKVIGLGNIIIIPSYVLQIIVFVTLCGTEHGTKLPMPDWGYN